MVLRFPFVTLALFGLLWTAGAMGQPKALSFYDLKKASADLARCQQGCRAALERIVEENRKLREVKAGETRAPKVRDHSGWTVCMETCHSQYEDQVKEMQKDELEWIEQSRKVRTRYAEDENKRCLAKCSSDACKKKCNQDFPAPVGPDQGEPYPIFCNRMHGDHPWTSMAHLQCTLTGLARFASKLTNSQTQGYFGCLNTAKTLVGEAKRLRIAF
jgi:hypothetical protein